MELVPAWDKKTMTTNKVLLLYFVWRWEIALFSLHLKNINRFPERQDNPSVFASFASEISLMRIFVPGRDFFFLTRKT